MSLPETEKPKRENQPAPALIVFLIVPVLGILAALIMVLNDGRSKPPLVVPEALIADSAALLDFTAPDFTLPDLDGKSIALKDFRGKVLFLNFWQTTCEPCVRELPALAEFAAERSDDAAVLTINFEETSAQVQDFLTTNDISGISVVLDVDSKIRYQYGVVAIPRTFIIDSNGVVRSMKIGEITVADMEAYLAEVEAS